MKPNDKYAKYYYKNFVSQNPKSFNTPKDKVGYTPEFVKEAKPEQNSKNKSSSHIVDMDTKRDKTVPQSNFETKKSSAKKTGCSFNVLIILLCFAITLLACNLISNGYLTQELFNLIDPETAYTYYVVSNKAGSDVQEAKNISRVVKESGGASNIISENNVYYVALAVYLTENEAKSVAKKNPASVILTFKHQHVKEASISQFTYLELQKILILSNQVISQFVELSMLESEEEIITKASDLEKYAAELLSIKDKTYLKNLSNIEKSLILDKANLILGLIESLSFTSPYTHSATRYASVELSVKLFVSTS